VGTVPLEENAPGTRPVLLNPEATWVICANLAMGPGDPTIASQTSDEDLEITATEANIPAPLIDSAVDACDFSPTVAATIQNGTDKPLLASAALYGTVLLRSTQVGKDVVDALVSVPQLFQRTDKHTRETDEVESCNVAWIRNPSVRSNQPIFNGSDWVHVVGAHCSEPETTLSGMSAFSKYYMYVFGQQRNVPVLDACESRLGMPSAEFGVIEAPAPEPAAIPEPTPLPGTRIIMCLGACVLV
jgi:hypothetical protein